MAQGSPRLRCLLLARLGHMTTHSANLQIRKWLEHQGCTSREHASVPNPRKRPRHIVNGPTKHLRKLSTNLDIGDYSNRFQAPERMMNYFAALFSTSPRSSYLRADNDGYSQPSTRQSTGFSSTTSSSAYSRTYGQQQS
ncbi:hypothetical protein LZ30DRAFT_690862 [Colletotrichum cereale]|nr:hypothetical protein LZ30DRAFT_690862 [Colletotrichum cereale]